MGISLIVYNLAIKFYFNYFYSNPERRSPFECASKISCIEVIMESFIFIVLLSIILTYLSFELFRQTEFNRSFLNCSLDLKIYVTYDDY